MDYEHSDFECFIRLHKILKLTLGKHRKHDETEADFHRRKQSMVGLAWPFLPKIGIFLGGAAWPACPKTII
jgi:hypothetical protein